MSKLSCLLVVALALVACKKKDGAAGGGDDCASVIPGAVDRVVPDMEKDLGGAVPKDKLAQIAPKLKEVLLVRCKEDKWSADYLKCLANGKSSADMDACDKLLPKEQKDKVDKALEEALAPIMEGAMKHKDEEAPPAEPTPAPSEPAGATGSADGSAAGSGSATP